MLSLDLKFPVSLPKHAENGQEYNEIEQEDSILHQTFGISNIDEPETWDNET